MTLGDKQPLPNSGCELNKVHTQVDIMHTMTTCLRWKALISDLKTPSSASILYFMAFMSSRRCGLRNTTNG